MKPLADRRKAHQAAITQRDAFGLPWEKNFSALKRAAKSAADEGHGGLFEALCGQIEVFDLTTSVLNENLFGVDLNGESVEITKLSLWLKTARRDKRLTYLDGNVRRGNSVVDDAMRDPWAFDWQTGRTARRLEFDNPADPEAAAAIDARWCEGFDVVLGNPPYVRQEMLTRYKEHWKHRFPACFDGVADLFVYFFERGLSVLKPGGRLGFIVSNKWLRAGYGEKLRAHLASTTAIERVIDFGHAPIFPDADAFPVIVSVRKLADDRARPPEAHAVTVTQFPREELNKVEVPSYVETHRFSVPQITLRREGWTLEPPAVHDLMEKLRQNGVTLGEYTGTKPFYGIKTGCNEAFLIDQETKDRLCRDDPRSSAILKRYRRGQDIVRWSPEWAGLWMIYARWDLDLAAYPAVAEHLGRHRRILEARAEVHQSRFPWYALSRYASDYVDLFEKPTLPYSDILWSANFCNAPAGTYINNTVYLLSTEDSWLLACLDSPLMWAYLWRTAQHGKDEALRMFGDYVVGLPIARPTAALRDPAETIIGRLMVATRVTQQQRASVLDLLRMQHQITEPGNALTSMEGISSDTFVTEVLKRRPRPPKGTKAPKGLSAAAQRELRQLYEHEVAPMEERRGAVRADERALSRLVNKAYGLTPTEERLLWDTAPPRMPDAR